MSSCISASTSRTRALVREARPSARRAGPSRCSARRPSARRSLASSSAPASRCTGGAADAPRCPTRTSPRDPTSPFGASLAEVEDIAASAGWAADVPVTLLRMAPVVGPHVPSPLGRYLRMAPIVPISAFADPPFSLLHQEDAVAAVIAAATATPYDGPLNVVGSGRGHRVPGGAARRPHPAARSSAPSCGSSDRSPSCRARRCRLTCSRCCTAGALPTARSRTRCSHRAAVDGRRREGPLRVGDRDASAASPGGMSSQMDTRMSTLADVVRRRIDGSYVVDEWGFDPDFVALLAPLFASAVADLRRRRRAHPRRRGGGARSPTVASGCPSRSRSRARYGRRPAGSCACSACPTSRRSVRCCDGWGLCRIVPTSSPACSAPGSSARVPRSPASDGRAGRSDRT